jgi:hypothetical protein
MEEVLDQGVFPFVIAGFIPAIHRADTPQAE